MLVKPHEDEGNYGFTGKGYYKGTLRLFQPMEYYSVVLAFRTLDENALLFLAINEEKVKKYLLF